MFAVVDMTGQEQLLIELVNRMRANPTAEAARYEIDLDKDLEPNEISTKPKQPVAPNLHLRNSARLHSDNMLARDFFGHEDPLTGTAPSDRAKAAGYPAGAGENISWRGESRPLQQTVEVYNVHEDLFRSEGHRRNTMTPHYRELGTGVRYGQFSTENDDGILRSFFSIMATENFGNQGGNAFITGVAYTDRVQANNFYEVSEGIAGATIQATNTSTKQVYTTTTSSSGGYTLRVPDGVYSVTGVGAGLPPATFQNVVIDGRNQKVDFNARDRGFGTIGGRVFEDINENGKRDANESYLAGQRIHLGNNYEGYFDQTFASTTTDANGFFQFSTLPSEPYRVFADLPHNRLSTAPNNKGVYELDLHPSHTINNLLFGLARVNEPPIANADKSNTPEGESVEIDIAANDTDEEDQIDRSSIEITDEPMFGTVHIDPVTNNAIYLPNDGHIGWDVFGYKIKDKRGAISERTRVDIETLKGLGALWQNSKNRVDVNNDEALSPIDALLVINDLIKNGPRALSATTASVPPPFIDVSGDNFVSSIDALQVINALIARDPASATPQQTDPISTNANATLINNTSDRLRHSTEFAAAVDIIWSDDDDRFTVG
ncbi:MAG: carboxypeptidase regulatory-like domain-containing protein [Planctomycetales bacterium]|nr:carboxypeptidase regulatory-like domain-containing protein [Planctomycetales bacterium]